MPADACASVKRSDFDQVCRICLQTKPMFCIHEPEIFQMFQYITDIHIHIKDGLPNQICQNCFMRLTDSFQFKQLCEDSHRTLLEIRDASPKDTVECIDGEGEVKQEVDELVKPACESDEDDMWLSDRLDSTLDPDTLTCKTCNKTLSTEGSLIRHLRTHEDSKYRCDVCNKEFHDKSYHANHMKRHQSDSKYQCDYCDASFFELNTLCAHVTKKHDPTPHTCTVCHKTFVVKLKLDAHMKVHSTEKDHLCTVCGKGFHKRHLLRKHQKHHATERIYHCLQCEKSFRVEATLRLHYKRCHTGEKKREVCTVCGKAVLNIKAHLNTHSNEKPFKCTECPKEFSNKYNLEEHRKRKHGDPAETTKRPYLCSICGKGSVSTTALKTHYQHMHTAGKRYPCPICNKKFKTDKAVNAHVRYTHNDERRYACTVCAKSFQTSTILKIHMRVHTGERPFACKLCGKAFGQASTLKTHMKVHGFESDKAAENHTTSTAPFSTIFN